MPERIQLRRIKGWRMPANTVCVTRGPGRVFGNLFEIGEPGVPDAETAVALFCAAVLLANYCHAVDRANEGMLPTCFIDIMPGPVPTMKGIRTLRGKNLACWCRLCPVHADGLPLGTKCPDCAPCHADVLLELANG